MLLILKPNFWFEVNTYWRTTCCVTLYVFWNPKLSYYPSMSTESKEIHSPRYELHVPVFDADDDGAEVRDQGEGVGVPHVGKRDQSVPLPLRSAIHDQGRSKRCVLIVAEAVDVET